MTRERGTGWQSWISLRAKPPLWFRIYGLAVCCLLPLGLFGRRGTAVGILAVLVYGGVGLLNLFVWDRTVQWSQGHRLADRLLIVPFIFLLLAYITTMSSALCLLISLCVGLPLATGQFLWWRHKQASRGGER